MAAMKNTRISFFTNVNKTQIIDNGDYFELRGIPVTKDDAVMNGLHYPEDENKAGMPSLIDRVVTLSHPTNKAGDGADAYEGDSLMEFFSGGVVKNHYCDNGIHKVDARIKKKLLKAQDEANGTDFYDRLDNKKDIGVSTGLYCMAEETPGTNKIGEKYTGIARKQNYNHLAMLAQNEPPAGGDDTYMRFNSDETVSRMVVNLDEYLTNQPTSPTDNLNDNSSGLDFTGGHRATMAIIEELLTTAIKSELNIEHVYIHDWNEDTVIFWSDDSNYALNYIFDGETMIVGNDPKKVTLAPIYKKMANVDYMPESTYKRIDTTEAEPKDKDEIKSLFLKLLAMIGIGGLFANKNAATYNNDNDDLKPNEERDMADIKKMKADLQTAGKLKEDMTDEEVKNAYDKMSANAEGVKAVHGVNTDFTEKLEAMEARLNSVEEENKNLKAQINSESEAEKNKIINDLETADIGLEKTDLEAMKMNALKKLHTKHCFETNSLGKFAPKTNSSDFDDMPEMEVH